MMLRLIIIHLYPVYMQLLGYGQGIFPQTCLVQDHVDNFVYFCNLCRLAILKSMLVALLYCATGGARAGLRVFAKSAFL